MPINNPAGEQHAEQLRMHAEELRDEKARLINRLADIFGSKEFEIEPDGSVSHKFSALELDDSQRGELAEAEKRLKEIYAEAKKAGIEI